MYLNTFFALRAVDQRLVDVAKVLGLGRAGLTRHVLLPGALPGFLVGFRQAVAFGWLALVVVEQVNATSGVGFLLQRGRETFHTDLVVVALVVYGLLAMASDAILRTVERRVLVWRAGYTPT